MSQQINGCQPTGNVKTMNLDQHYVQLSGHLIAHLYLQLTGHKWLYLQKKTEKLHGNTIMPQYNVVLGVHKIK